MIGKSGKPVFRKVMLKNKGFKKRGKGRFEEKVIPL